MNEGILFVCVVEQRSGSPPKGELKLRKADSMKERCHGIRTQNALGVYLRIRPGESLRPTLREVAGCLPKQSYGIVGATQRVTEFAQAFLPLLGRYVDPKNSYDLVFALPAFPSESAKSATGRFHHQHAAGGRTLKGNARVTNDRLRCPANASREQRRCRREQDKAPR